jgi:urease accessory protein
MAITITAMTMGTNTANATASAGCPAIRTTATTMADGPAGSALLRLLAWLSPAFPVGGFSYSHGLERAVQDGLVGDRDALEEWISTLLEAGSGWNDAVLFAESWRRAAEGRVPADLAELAEALAGSEERHREATLQGSAFLAAARAGWPHPVLADLPQECAYAVAVGSTAGAHGVPLDAALAAFLQAFASNLIQAGIRLSVLGQSGAVGTLAALEPLLARTAARAKSATPDDLGGAALWSDIMAMKHETLETRLFRS